MQKRPENQCIVRKDEGLFWERSYPRNIDFPLKISPQHPVITTLTQLLDERLLYVDSPAEKFFFFTSIGQEALSLLAAVSYFQAAKLLSKHLSKYQFKIRCVLLVLRRPNYGVF